MRLYNLTYPIIGLTGGIATGKSTVSQILIQNEYPVLCADKLIKEIYNLPETVQWLNNNYPQFLSKEGINFPKMRDHFFQNNKFQKELEKFLYKKLPDFFLKSAKKIQSQFLIYDIPLLFEKKLENQFDAIVLVYCTPKEQLKRLCKRDNLSEKKAQRILDKQIPIDTKKKKSKFIIDNSMPFDKVGKDHFEQKVLEIINKVKDEIL